MQVPLLLSGSQSSQIIEKIIYWILYSNEWAILYPKIETVEPPEEKPSNNISWFQKIFNAITNFFKKIFKISDN